MSDRRDPTRSAGLRRHGRTIVNKRIYALSHRLRQALKEHDVAGLREGEKPPVAFINWEVSASYKLARSEGIISSIIDQALMYPENWPGELIARSVDHGIALVEQELRAALGHIDPREVSRLHEAAATVEVRGIAGETQRRLLRFVVRALETKETPEELMRDVRTTLEKITRLRLHLMVNTGVVRAVNAGKLLAYADQGIQMVGISPEWLPDRATRQHDGMACHHHRPGVAISLRDTKTLKAKRRKRVKENKRRRKLSEIEKEILEQSLGTPALRVIEKLEEAEEKITLVNVLTAGDDKVCQDCEDIAADGPYDLDQAKGLIPAHPNCRCAFIPWGDRRFAEIEEQYE